jgi:hypothetical protein
MSLSVNKEPESVSFAVLNLYRWKKWAGNVNFLDRLSVIEEKWNVYIKDEGAPALFVVPGDNTLTAVIMPLAFEKYATNPEPEKIASVETISLKQGAC